MRRNCNLELQLLPPSATLQSAEHHNHLLPMLGLLSESPNERAQQQQQQQLTIFYDGRVNVSQVTELQARAIIMLASQEMEEKLKSLLLISSEPSSPSNVPKSPTSCNPSAGLSMKRSLQRFLQKRKNRIQATSPY